MESEILFTEQKWNILKFLSENDYSPLELSDITETSRANISQQLKLLDAVNLIKKKKVPNRDKGKPRAMYSLTKDFAYLILVSNGFAGKSLIELDDHKKILMRIWLMEDQELQYYIEQAYLHVESIMKHISLLLVKGEGEPTMFLVGKGLKEKGGKFSPILIKKPEGGQMRIKFEILDEEVIKKKLSSFEHCYVLHDPNRIMFGKN